MIKIGSQFSGVGAFDEALKRLGIGYLNVYQAEMDKYARITYLENNEAPLIYDYDVYDTDIESLTEKYGSLDIAMFSPPCQAFSLAGNRKGEDDERGVLFYQSLNFIRINKPRFFIFENVKGLLSSGKGAIFGKWIDFLGGKSINGNVNIFPNNKCVPYHIYWDVLNAKDYGVPQNRERVFIVGIRDDCDNLFTFPKKEPLDKRLKDVLEVDVDDKYFLSDKLLQWITSHREKRGSNNDFPVDLDKPMPCIKARYCKNGAEDPYIVGYTRDSNGNVSKRHIKNISGTIHTGTGNGGNTDQFVLSGAIRGRSELNEQTLEIRNDGNINTITSVQKDNVIIEMRKDEGVRTFKDNLCGTIRTKDAGGDKYVLPNGKHIGNTLSIRKLTPRECFRLMDFPDSFNISAVSNSQAYKQAGNSIVVGVLAKIINQLNLKNNE